MEDLESIIRSLDRLGRKKVLTRLQPGLTPSAIEGMVRRVGVAPPANWVALYAWRDGTAVEAGESLDDLHFFPGFYLMSLEDALASYRAFRDDARWGRAWFPIFANGGGDFYAIDLAAGDDTDAPVVGFMLGESEHPIEYEGIAPMLATIAACYDEGAFYVDDRGYLEVDDDRHATIARMNNPNLPLWN